MMSSLVQRLEEVIRDRRRRRRCHDRRRDESDSGDDDPILFASRGERRRRRRRPPPPVEDDDDDDDDDDAGDLTYGECLEVIAEHERWLIKAIRHQLLSIDRENRSNAVECVDVVVGYLSDNSPDLLLSVLACTDLTLPSKTSSFESTTPGTTRLRLLPAMVHCRWTPTEAERALRPNDDDDIDIDGIDVRHVTILLHGPGYERTATEAARLMNASSCRRRRHDAVAAPLPGLAAKRQRGRRHRRGGRIVVLDRSHRRPEDAPSSSSSSTPPLPSGAMSDVDALIIFTSGTTSSGIGGGGKGVRLSHRSLFVQSHAKTLPPCSYDEDTRLVATTVPWFHVGGMSSAIAVVLAGGTLAFPTGDASAGGRFRPEAAMGMFLPTSSSSSSSSSEASSEAAVANTLAVVPAMLHSMTECAARPHRDDDDRPLPSSSSSFPNVRLILVGGQSIFGYGGGGLFDLTRRMFPNARVVQTYACTEAGSSMTFEDLTSGRGGASPAGDGGGSDETRTMPSTDVDSAVAGPGTCVGYPPPHIEIGIFHAEKATEAARSSSPPSALRLPPQLLLSHGKTGIIGTRGPHVMSGYWSRGGIGGGDDIAPVVDGWVLTNDLGYIHPLSGKLYFRGRADDVIRTGGESVLAADVERVILDFVDDDDDSNNANDEEKHIILECVVFPLPDEKFGEAVCAVVVLRSKAEVAGVASAGVGGGTMIAPGATPVTKTSDDYGDSDVTSSVEEDEQLMERIRRHCSERQLSSFKQPRRVFRMQALPRNSSGKVLKHAIIKLCASMAKKMSRL